MPNEWNNIMTIDPEKVAELFVEVSKAIKAIDSDAKIVALSSFDEIWTDNHYTNYYSATESGHNDINHNSWLARVLKTKFMNDNNLEIL